MELTSEDKGFTRTEVSDENGRYNFALVPAGPYRVAVSLSGFDTVTKSRNLVEAQKTTEVDAIMQLGAVAAEITVTGEVPIVDKTSPASEHRFRKEELETLPVGRGYQAIFGRLRASAPALREPNRPWAHQRHEPLPVRRDGCYRHDHRYVWRQPQL